MIEFDFEDWAKLYEADPKAFEQRRGAALEAFVKQAPDHSRHALEQTLFRIEMTRKTAKSPLQAAINASKLMWESYGKLREHVEMVSADMQSYQANSRRLRLVEAGGEEPASVTLTQPVASPTLGKNSARIIQLPRRS